MYYITRNAKLFSKAGKREKDYRNRISSAEALRPLLSAAVLNLI
jgi:hypothetical protein